MPKKSTIKKTKAKNQKWLRVVILTAIPLEFDAVKRRLKNSKEKMDNQRAYQIGTFEPKKRKYKICLGQVDVGNVAAALGTQAAVNYFKPHIVIFVGIGG